MKRLGRLFFDVLGLGFAVAAIIMGLVAITGHVPAWDKVADDVKATWESKNVLREIEPHAFWMGVAAIAVGGLAGILSIIAILMVFSSKSHTGLTMAIFVLAIIAAGLAAYTIYKYHNISKGDIEAFFPKKLHI